MTVLFIHSKYADILASQGSLQTAMGYLMACNDQVSAVQCDVIFN